MGSINEEYKFNYGINSQLDHCHEFGPRHFVLGLSKTLLDTRSKKVRESVVSGRCTHGRLSCLFHLGRHPNVDEPIGGCHES